MILVKRRIPEPITGEFLIRKSKPARVCRTHLHVMDGDVTAARLLLVPGHETVGTVIDVEHGVDPIPRFWRSLARPQVP